EAVREMIHKIVRREGLGDILAEGVLRAIEQIGEESAYYAIQVKGQFNVHSDERATPALALGIATATRGADHLRSRPTIDFYHLPPEVLENIFGGPVSSEFTSYDGKSREIWFAELLYAIVDAMGICKFQTKVILSPSTPGFEEYSELIYNITGLEISPSDLKEIGERIYTLERMFNIREGKSRKDDYMPERYYVEETKDGVDGVRGVKLDRKKFDQMLDEYYELHQWDNDGNPRPGILEKLGLDKEPSHML
ncbi:MAG: aldehyde ferredoxin oxidoreductase C-terminal domain-containing protein, partial [Candidatus Hodarchaeota archaeon]